MALVKEIEVSGIKLKYWHLFQLVFDYPSNSFIVRFNGYIDKDSRSNFFNGLGQDRPIHTDSYFLDRATANKIAAIIYESAKNLDTYQGATDDDAMFLPEITVEPEPAPSTGIISSIAKIFKKS